MGLTKIHIMNKNKFIVGCAAVAALVFGLTAAASAVVVAVKDFGDHGWRSDDTRNTSGVDLVGTINTHAGRPGQTATAADDAAIASQIQFVDGPVGSTYGGAVSIDGTSSNSGKSTISVINPSGFDAAGNLLTSFSATYEWYKQPNPTERTLAFRLGIQSTDWAASQASFTAARSGESMWDLVLVHLSDPSISNAWNSDLVDHDTGMWNLYDQAGNAYFTTPGGATSLTLDAWNSDATWGPLLFGTGAKVTSVQFGLGSSQRNALAYVDYLQTNLLNEGDVIDFQAVPEPKVISFLGLGLGALLMRRRRQAVQIM